MKATLTIASRLVALAALYVICFAAVSAALLPPPSGQPAPAEAGAGLTPLLAVSFLTTVMSQIESAFFLTRLPPGMLPRLFLSGAIIAALVSPLAVLILGKRRPDPAKDESHPRLNMPAGEWVGKLALIVIAYVVIYFTFGYFIAWKSPAVRAYYGGSDPGSFLAQMGTVVRDTPLLLPLQAVRAILWAAIAVPVIRMMKGQ